MTGRGLRTTTTSLAIAEGVGLQHKNVLGLIRQNLEELRELGNIAFQTRNSIGAGRHTQYTILNEPQATLLLTFMRNSPKVKYFKVLLVKEFYRMREQLKNTQAPAQLSRMEILLQVNH